MLIYYDFLGFTGDFMVIYGDPLGFDFRWFKDVLMQFIWI